MLWAIYALLHSLFRAMFVETGRLFQADGWIRMFLQAIFGTLLLLPFMPLMQWPDDGRFYFAAILIGLVVTVGMLIQLNLSAQQHGRVSGIYMPLEAMMAFLIWTAITPSGFEDMTGDWLKTISTALALALATLALLIVRPNDIGWKNSAVVAPVGVSFAIAGVVTKLILPASNLIPIVLAYVLINFGVMTIVMGLVVLIKRKAATDILSTRVLRGGVITGLFSASSYITFVAGVVLAPNPGYTSFMAMMLPVWMIGLHKLFRTEERASPVAAFLLVISALTLIFAVV
jgi:hypothetical protein